MRERRAVLRTEDEARLDQLLDALIESGRFRRSAIRALREHGMTLAEWRVLRTTYRVMKEVDDAVSQQEVARSAGMHTPNVSHAMERLLRRGFVDVGFDAWGWSQRILVTPRGERALQRMDSDVAGAAKVDERRAVPSAARG